MSRVFEWPVAAREEHNYYSYTTPNPAQNPEACGLKIVVELDDPAASYSFDSLIVWQDMETGRLYAAHDSGCSCPTPFESIKGLGDLAEINSVEDAKAFIQRENYDGYKGLTWPLADVSRALDKIDEALKESDVVR